jgi:hypothetical protein
MGRLKRDLGAATADFHEIDASASVTSANRTPGMVTPLTPQ